MTPNDLTDTVDKISEQISNDIEESLSFLRDLKNRGNLVRITKCTEKGMTTTQSVITFIGVIKEIQGRQPLFLILEDPITNRKSRVVFLYYKDCIEEL